jgi:hypothetical protein
MSRRRLLPVLVLALLALPATAGAALHEGAAAASAAEAEVTTTAKSAKAAKASRAAPRARTVIRTRRSWECRGRLRAYGRLPIKVISNMPNPGDGDAIRLIGCRGDGKRRTVDLILDVNGNGRDRGTASDAVRIGMDARDLKVTGDVECGARHTNPSIHQDIVQALSGRNIRFVNFTSGNMRTGDWTCWGAGGGWYVTWANGGIPTNLICNHCRLSTCNQNLRIDESVHSGAKNSYFRYHRSYGKFIGDEARRPVDKNNRVRRHNKSYRGCN